jgi:hypothetical protein
MFCPEIGLYFRNNHVVLGGRNGRLCPCEQPFRSFYKIVPIPVVAYVVIIMVQGNGPFQRKFFYGSITFVNFGHYLFELFVIGGW